MESKTYPTNWTTRQIAAYEALKASSERFEAKRLNTASIFNKAPKSGWTDADRVTTK